MAELQAPEAFARFMDIIRRLRSPGGCPWDREQTPATLRANLLEEAWECVTAIEAEDDENLQEELGDLLLVAGMIAYMKEQEGSFSVGEVLEGICAKLVRRHPHVFAAARKSTPEQVLEQWHEIKAREKAGLSSSGGDSAPPSLLEGVPRALPPLERANLLQEKASRVGFDWKSPEPVWEKLEEETVELKEAWAIGDLERVEQELGDLLFTVVNLARLLKVDPSLALNRTNGKFLSRFGEVERRLRQQGLSLSETDLETLDGLWNQVKDEELP